MDNITKFFKELLEIVELDHLKQIKKIEIKYSVDFSVEVFAWISLKNREVINNKSSKVRILDLDEILCAPEELHVDFIKHGVVPLADCLDNDFFVFNIRDNSFCLFNIVDESSFGVYKSIYDFLTET